MSNKLNHGGPTYPVLIDNRGGQEDLDVCGEHVSKGHRTQFMGMSLREHYAGLAMQSLMTETITSYALTASLAFDMADAMLAVGERIDRESDKVDKAGGTDSEIAGELLSALKGLYGYVDQYLGGNEEYQPPEEHPLTVAKRLIDRMAVED